jgi:transposase
VRFQRADLFAQGVEPAQVAVRLRVNRKSAGEWYRAWARGGKSALASKGPSGSKCGPSDRLIQVREAEFAKGPAADGWDEDQRWTLARVAQVIRELFGQEYTLRGVSYLLRGRTP